MVQNQERIDGRNDIELTSRAVGQSGRSTEAPTAQDPLQGLGTSTTAIIITCVTAATMISSLLSGALTIALPTIARELNMSPALVLWPVSIYSLTCGCSLVLCGAVADIVGSRNMYLVGCALQSAFLLAAGLARSQFQLLAFRALAGFASSFCLPSAVSLIAVYFPHGRRRNIAFAAMGGGEPIGFSVGLTLGGVLVDGPGWRLCFFIGAAINTVILLVAIPGLPKTKPRGPPLSWGRLAHAADWVGVIILTSSLALFSYIFAALTGNISTIRHASTISMLCVAMALVPVFSLWVGRQERLNRPALIPNSLWRNRSFVAICLVVFFVWGAFNAAETLVSFYFQDVELISGSQSSLRFLSAPVAGAITNLLMGLLVHRLRAHWLVEAALVISAVGQLLVAFANPRSSYWRFVFPGLTLNPVGAAVLFTVSNLLISSTFSDRSQALAGGVFNTVAQVGKSVGLAVTAIIAGSVTLRTRNASSKGKPSTPGELLEGYRAAWWFCVAITGCTVLVSHWGLRRVGKLGQKRE